MNILQALVEFIKEDKVIGQETLDIGMFIEAGVIERSIREAATAHRDWWRECDSIGVFGMVFSKQFILSHKSSAECALAIEKIMRGE